MQLLLNPIYFLLIKAARLLVGKETYPLSDGDVATSRSSEREFLRIFKNNERIIWQVVHQFHFGYEDRRDLFHEIFIRLWRSWGDYRGDATRTTWVRKIATYTAIATVEKRKEREIGLIFQEYSKNDLPFGFENNNLPSVQGLIESLPPEDLAILFLRSENFNDDEIAAITGMKPNTIAQRMKRMRDQITDISL